MIEMAADGLRELGIRIAGENPHPLECHESRLLDLSAGEWLGR